MMVPDHASAPPPYYNHAAQLPIGRPVEMGHQQIVMGQPISQPTLVVMASAYLPSQAINISPLPVVARCPFCSRTGHTLVTSRPGRTVWSWCLILWCFTGCCCIPFCIDSCQARVHHCQACQAELGVYEPPMCP